MEGSKKCPKADIPKKDSSPKGYVFVAPSTPDRQHQFFRLLLSEGRCRDPGRSGELSMGDRCGSPWHTLGTKPLLSVVRGCRGVDFRGWLVL